MILSMPPPFQTHLGKPKPANKWKPWRKIAKKAQIKSASKIKPEDNNYDGRNYITEDE